MRTVRDEPISGEVVVKETLDDGGVRTAAGRVIGSVAAAVPIVMGLVAVVRIQWSDGFDAAPVEVTGIAFSPQVALITLGLGVLALAAAAVGDRAGDILMGAVFACIGIALIAARPTATDWALSEDLGWIAVTVGAVLVVAGFVTAHGWRYRRSVHRVG